MKSRIITLFICVCALWGLLILRASYLQLLPNKKLGHLQDKQFKTVVNLQARRGNITDHLGREMAMSAPAYSIYADPGIIENPKSVSQFLGKTLGDNPKTVYSKIKDKSKRFVWLDRLVDVSLINKIKDRKIRGIGFVEEWKRVYPNDFLLSSVMGFVGKEGQGLEGLELAYDKDLKGENKKVTLMKDAKGRPIIQDGMMFKEVPQGKDIVLTIDSDLQFFVETELLQAIKKHDADGAYAVVLDAKTSAIRAMASLPHYNLNSPSQFTSYQRRNRSVTDTFEPGSTMKTFVIAEALEKKLFQPESKIFCENGRFKIGKRIIREAEKDHSQGLITVNEVLAYSSNIGTSKIALQLGDKNLKAGLNRFGFGQKMGIDMPGEAKGIMVPLPWKDHLLANVSFGQGVTATPLQLANAYAVIANGGVLNRPYIVDTIKDPEGIDPDIKTQAQGRRVLSEAVAEQMKNMLIGVTTGKGTGLSARVPGYTVGGKTGTAQKINPNGKGYSGGGYIGSFAGFIPANDPQYVIFVAVDRPRKDYYGSIVAAPIFSSIASYAVRKEGIRPEIESDPKLNLATQAENTNYVAQTTEDVQFFDSQDLINESDLLTAAPDLKNLTVRQVFEKIQGKNLNVKIIGSGKVYQSSPDVGQALNDKRQITVYLKE